MKTINLDPDLKDLKWNDLISKLVPSWHQKGTNLSELDWPQIQLFLKKVSSLPKKDTNLVKTENVNFSLILKDYLKKEPGLIEKSINLMHKKSNYILSILVLTSEPIKLEKMMEWIGYKNRKTFR